MRTAVSGSTDPLADLPAEGLVQCELTLPSHAACRTPFRTRVMRKVNTSRLAASKACSAQPLHAVADDSPGRLSSFLLRVDVYIDIIPLWQTRRDSPTLPP